ncbi:MAG: HD domain-containing protein [Clostridiales bacterium]|nr:HD domain-containing protein [Clostridiales bacterium]
MNILIFGGAFDPPHGEHKRILSETLNYLRDKGIIIDKTVIVPTYNPPHKEGAFFSFDTRFKMCEAFFEGCEVSDIEKRRGENNYTCEVLKEFKSEGHLYYLVGGDSLMRIDGWHKPKEIFSLASIVAVKRSGYTLPEVKADELRKKYGSDIKILTPDIEGENISSTMLKARALMGDFSELSETVKEIIINSKEAEKYYDILRKLKSYQSESLFYHSKMTVLRAVDINSYHNLKIPFEKVFLSALLHDNAKERLTLDGFDVPADAIGTPVLHQFLGAEKAKRDFGITDEDILSAIRYHTTGRAGMSTLEKLIYSADMLSFDRDYPDIDKLVAAIYNDFEDGFFATLKHGYEFVIKKGVKIYPLTETAYNYYKKEEKNECSRS